ncbi:hypothetical protein AOCH_001188 [Aspergillus ochraceoroseus]|uniref:COP9 signalosome complex subunit 3 n=1 Tax=Aspergillus ochraceoroseus TaxID=138278 RepID=A0A0F8X0P0_9EURO|nr:hypothetical protein AOCH_001188 [Aspergillus ochraceoroseus]
MTELLKRLTAAPSRRYLSINVTDENYDRQLRDLAVYCKYSGVVSNITDFDEYLDNINPSIHTLSFLHILHFQIQSLQAKTKSDLPEDLLPGGRLWTRVSKFLKTFDPIQIRYAGHEWRQLVELVARAAHAPRLAVKLIRDALCQLDLSFGVFTSVHLIFVKLALRSASYTIALPILDRLLCHFPTGVNTIHHESFLCSEDDTSVAFITDVSGLSAKLTYRDHLQYYLYSGMIYMALKKWDQALHCLSAVISSPALNSVSKIMAEAYKKWILASLLGYGKLQSLSRMISPHVMRVYQSLAKPYISLADTFEKGDLQKMRAEIELGQTIWRIDNNAGLVSQLFDAFDKYTVLKLGRTFSALTMADVRQRVSASSGNSHNVEGFVASLVMSNALRATLSHLPGLESLAMLRFSSAPESAVVREETVRIRLIEAGLAANTVSERIRQSNRILELCQENLQTLAKSQKWADNTGRSSEAGGSFDIDEDLMGDGH